MIRFDLVGPAADSQCCKGKVGRPNANFECHCTLLDGDVWEFSVRIVPEVSRSPALFATAEDDVGPAVFTQQCQRCQT